jgi:pathogenesis-related protein 1
MSAAARCLAASGVSLLLACNAVSTVEVTAHGQAAEAGGLAVAQTEETVQAHNAWRRRAGVAPLRWVADLAARAQARAEYLAAHGCIIEHGLLPDNVGENLYYLGPWRSAGRRNELVVVSATEIVDAWGAESANYAPMLSACAPNRQCGHYTQMVWRTTEELGCGMAICPTLGQVWVCDYRPPGNIRRLR